MASRNIDAVQSKSGMFDEEFPEIPEETFNDGNDSVVVRDLRGLICPTYEFPI